MDQLKTGDVLRDQDGLPSSLHLLGVCFADADDDVAKARCSICNGVLHDYGRNAQPVSDGLCCTQCNHAQSFPRVLRGCKRFLRSHKGPSCREASEVRAPGGRRCGNSGSKLFPTEISCI